MVTEHLGIANDKTWREMCGQRIYRVLLTDYSIAIFVHSDLQPIEPLSEN